MSTIDTSKISKEIKDKSVIKDNTFIQVAKDNPKDKIDVEIGDSKTLDKFLPQQKIMRWDNEVNCSVRLIHDEKNPTVKTEGDKIVWEGDKIKAEIYQLTEDEGGQEFEITLKEKPKSNVVQFTVVDKGVDYFYQPALTPEEIAEGASRPENVEGSYAVYASENKTNYVGGKEYKCGKVGHIFRPKIIDSAGTEVWGDLHIENGILSVTIPQDFLDKAVYPVRHAAGLTFGYTTQYSTASGIQNSIQAMFGNPGQSGTVSSITVYFNTWAAGQAVQCALYDASGNFVASTDERTTGGTGWQTFNFAVGVAVTSQNYKIAIWTNSSTIKIVYGTVGGAIWYNKYSTAYKTWPASITWSSSSDYAQSIYATYTAGGGGIPNRNYLGFF
jgi:ASC-1-like (ASCH) protein